MRRSFIFVCLAAVSAAQESESQTPVSEQTEQVVREALSLRATHVRPGGIVTIDRGGRDGLALRDRVVFHPLKGPSQPGRVRLLNERSAEVQLDNPLATFKAGTLGVVHVAQTQTEQEPAETQLQPVPVLGEHAPWENTDTDYEPGMPLLIQIDGVRPEERLPLLSGRIYSIGEARETSDDGRSDSFFRLGTEMHYENPMGRGGQVFFAGEINHRITNVDGQVDESTGTGRVDRLSYSWGGTRFEPTRHELGRFLQRGVPEFGIVDGYEWSQRKETGHRFGASAGFLPEPTPSMSSGDDFSVSAFYQWTADKRERLTATGAYQKTWHNGAADRDLLVGKFDFWPSEGWDFHATSWIDYYTSGDQAKGSGVELTRFLATTGKRWVSGDGLTFTFAHNRFPELDRNEFLPVSQQQLANNHDERVAADGWTWLNDDRRLHGRMGLWTDQDDEGADMEVGVEQFGVFHEDGRADVRLFGADGKFSTTYGVRLDYGMQMQNRRWDLSYEYSLNDQVGFTSANDELENHRIIGSYDYTSLSGWSLSVHAGAILWTQETALTAGFYLQKSF